MKRIIDYYLSEWKKEKDRQPLILRGARQVGKTYAVRELGKTFSSFIEINLDENEEMRKVFEESSDLQRVLVQISEATDTRIYPGNTLLFIDEIQTVPKAINLLRYFYEKMPELHVIAAGSLLDFAIEEVGMPVGRVTTLYMYPLTFLEFLVALGHARWAQTIVEGPDFAIEPLHEKLLYILGIYIAIGGMPKAVNKWIEEKSSKSVKKVHASLLYTYKQDFGKYAKKNQIKYLNLIFARAIEQLGRRFMFSHIGEYQKRELYPALELLEKAGLFYSVIQTAGQGIPLAAQADPGLFKIIFLDVGLSQAQLDLDLTSWFLDPAASFINKGDITEALIGQELLAYADPINKGSLYYWHRHTHGSDAEIDYLIQVKSQVVPIEVKAGINRRIISMHIFLDSHLNSSYGIRFWAGKPETEERIKSYPLYSVAKVMAETNEDFKASINYLTSEE